MATQTLSQRWKELQNTQDQVSINPEKKDTIAASPENTRKELATTKEELLRAVVHKYTGTEKKNAWRIRRKK